MLRLVRLLLPLFACAAPLAAQAHIVAQPVAGTEVVVTQVTTTDVTVGPMTGTPVTGTPVTVTSDDAAAGSGRFVASRPATVPRGIAAYGPFRVLDGGRAALVELVII